MTLNYKPRELDKMKHIESFVRDDKTLVEYRPHIWSDKRYIVAVLKKQKDKKHGTRTYYEPIYQSTRLDDSLFAYNNIHILDVMNMKRQKKLLHLKSEGQNVLKTLLLEADIDEQDNKRVTIAKPKQLKVNVIPVIDYDEICME